MPDRPASLAFDRIADEYDATRGGVERGRAVAPVLARHLPLRTTILEIGVGTGLVAGSVGELGARVVGVDLSAPMLSKAVARLGSRVALGDALRLPVATGSIRGAYAVWVLHLVADVRAVLAEVRRVLAPGGVFLVVPSVPIERRTDVHRLTRELSDRLHPPQDRPDRLVRLAADVGLVGAGEESFDTHVQEISPIDAADQIERRVFSALWDVDEATWHTEVEPVIDKIRELPEPARTRKIQNTYPLLVFKVPRA